MNERLGVAGSGAIACGLAAVAAARLGEAVLVARSAESAGRARALTAKLLSRMDAEGAAVTVEAGFRGLSARQSGSTARTSTVASSRGASLQAVTTASTSAVAIGTAPGSSDARHARRMPSS